MTLSLKEPCVFPFLLTIRSEENIHCWNIWFKIKKTIICLFVYLNLHVEIVCVQAKRLCSSHRRQTRWPTNPSDNRRINKGKIKLAKGFPSEKNIQC